MIKQKFRLSVLCTVVAASMLLPMAAYAIPQNEMDIAGLLYEMNIMRGDEDGNLRLDDPVTRAEFCKVAIFASTYRNSVAENMTISPFKDVSFRHWAAAYVKLAVSNKLITGYPDATFRPESNVLYEEGATVALKLLGYTDEDFGDSWPYGQTGLAANLELNQNVMSKVGDVMTRRDVMQLIYNMLDTHPKDANTAYIEKLNYKIVEDVVLTATAQKDSSIGSGYVSTSGGTFKITPNFDEAQVGKKGDLVVKNTNEVVSFVPNVQTVERHNVYQVLDGKVVVQDGGQLNALDLDQSLTVYNKSVKTTLQSMLPQLSAGDVLTVYKSETGVLDYGVVETDQLDGPYTVKSQDWQSVLGLTESTAIMRDGVKTTASAIQTNDILYYSKTIGTVWAYSKKITGVYESAVPNKDMPTSVVVSGVTYSIEGVNAVNALSSAGSYNFGDTITLLMGRVGSIADVAGASVADQSIVGLVTETGKKEFKNSSGEGYLSAYVKVALTDGTVGEYTTDQDYKNIKYRVVTARFQDGKAILNTVPASSGLSGRFDAAARTLGKTAIASDVQLLDVCTVNNATSSTGLYAKVYPNRLDGLDLAASNILYYEKNAKNEISKMVLNDVTGDVFSYGVITAATQGTKSDGTTSGMSTGLVCDIGGTVYSDGGGASYPVGVGSVVRATLSGGKLIAVKSMGAISGAVTALTPTTVTMGGTTYQLASNATLYERRDYGYYKTNQTAIGDIKDYSFSVYCDKPVQYGGRVRVMIMEKRR